MVCSELADETSDCAIICMKEKNHCSMPYTNNLSVCMLQRIISIFCYNKNRHKVESVFFCIVYLDGIISMTFFRQCCINMCEVDFLRHLMVRIRNNGYNVQAS